MAYEIVRFPHDGTIDADGHVLEPAWLWEEYLEERFRPRALRIGVDADGLERLELDGRPSERTTKGVLGLLGAMGDLDVKRGPERRTTSPTGEATRSSGSSFSTRRTSTRRCSTRRSACSGSASSTTPS